MQKKQYQKNCFLIALVFILVSLFLIIVLVAILMEIVSIVMEPIYLPFPKLRMLLDLVWLVDSAKTFHLVLQLELR